MKRCKRCSSRRRPAASTASALMAAGTRMALPPRMRPLWLSRNSLMCVSGASAASIPGSFARKAVHRATSHRNLRQIKRTGRAHWLSRPRSFWPMLCGACSTCWPGPQRPLLRRDPGQAPETRPSNRVEPGQHKMEQDTHQGHRFEAGLL